MSLIEHGTVIRTKRNKATVRILRRETCGSCNACGMGSKHMDLTIDNTTGLKSGDEVEITLQPARERSFAVIAYLIPLLFLTAGFSVGLILKLHELATVGIALLTLCLGFYTAYLVDKRFVKRHGLNPSVTKQVNREE